jgi:hypothetical protein
MKASLNYVGGVEGRAGVLHKRLESGPVLILILLCLHQEVSEWNLAYLIANIQYVAD